MGKKKSTLAERMRYGADDDRVKITPPPAKTKPKKATTKTKKGGK